MKKVSLFASIVASYVAISCFYSAVMAQSASIPPPAKIRFCAFPFPSQPFAAASQDATYNEQKVRLTRFLIPEILLGNHIHKSVTAFLLQPGHMPPHPERDLCTLQVLTQYPNGKPIPTNKAGTIGSIAALTVTPHQKSADTRIWSAARALFIFKEIVSGSWQIGPGVSKAEAHLLRAIASGKIMPSSPPEEVCLEDSSTQVNTCMVIAPFFN